MKPNTLRRGVTAVALAGILALGASGPAGAQDRVKWKMDASKNLADLSLI